MRLHYLIKAIQAGIEGHAGDTAAYKAAAFGTHSSGSLEQQLVNLTNPLPDISVSDLKSYAPGSFGCVLAKFLDRNQIQPLTLSSKAKSELQGTPLLAIRYPLLHDAFHVLLGFDTSLAGELGVWSFVAAQQYCAEFNRAAWIGRWFTRLLIPWQWKKLGDFEDRGRQLGQRAVCVITEPLEELFGMPLEEVRQRLKLSSQPNTD
ncbi:MAG: Coq4 family protein [Cyanobacteria bacterium P01_D01_bin.156]